MNPKEVIYIDVEDEITQIIEKVSSAKSSLVVLVLPKRSTVFQSIVNMKLLKRKASQAKKKVVLVTSEAGLMPLAGAVGVHVVKSLQDQPEIPPNPSEEADEAPINAEDDPEVDKKIDKSKPIGELAGLAAVGAIVAKNGDSEDTIEFDNDAVSGGEDAAGAGAAKEVKDKSSKAKGLGGKKMKIPNFDRFRKSLLIGAGVIILLIVLWILAFKVLPKATIVIQTNTSNVGSNLTLTLSQANQNLDPTNDVVPAKFQTVTKTSTSSAVNTTGSKTIGTEATGTITITNDNTSTPTDVPAGTQFTDSSGNYTFTSNGDATVPPCNTHFGFCTKPSSVSIPVTATAVGSSYNIAATSYTSSDSNIYPGFTIKGSAMTGGSSQTVQAVAQADVTSAQGQLSAPNSGQIQQQIEDSLKQAGYIPITATYVSPAPTYTPSAAVGTQANSITVTENVTYSMYGVKQSDLQTLIDNNVNLQINSATQSILDSGAGSASFTLISAGSASDQVSMQATSTIGAKLDANAIAKESAGTRSGDIKTAILQIPGVTNVTVKYSPFWVSSTPKNVKKVTVIIEKANGSQP